MVVNPLGEGTKKIILEESDEPNDMEPCIVAQIQLVEEKDVPPLIPGWKRTENGVFYDRPFNPDKKSEIPPLMMPYILKFECAGVRGLRENGWERISKPYLRVFLPPYFLQNETSKPAEFKLRIDNNGSAKVLQRHVFPKLLIPTYSLSTTPLVVELYDGSTLIASSYTPLSRFIGGQSWDAPTYVPGYDRRTGRSKEYKSVAAAIEEVRTAETLKKQRAAAAEEEKEKMMDEKEDDDEDDNDIDRHEETMLVKAQQKQEWVELTEDCNVIISTLRKAGEKEQANDGSEEREVKQEGDEDGAVIANEMEHSAEFKEKMDPFHQHFKLFRGRSVGLSSTQIQRKILTGNQRGPATAQDMIGFVKGYVMLVPSKENPKDARSVEHKITSVDQLESYRRICNTEYICRVYVYRASNLSPRTHLTSHTCNPYILVTNGDEADNQFNNEKNCSKNEVNPFFYQIIELRTLFPENSSLSIQIWDNDPMGANSMIGSTKIDLEQRLISGIPHGRKEYRKLLNPAYSTSQGLIQCKVDILTAEEARITKADELSPPQFQDYQLRLILWSTYGVKFPQLENRGLDVDQKIIVTSNFSGEKGEDIIKHTDVAWYAAEGCADWNYRMIFDVKLPCKNPRITISVWDEKVLGSNEAIGEVVLNLQTFFARCLLEKSARTRDKRKIVHFEHSNYRGVNLGSIKLEMTMYTKTEADENPAGEAQNEPNIDPYLPNPKRNAPPWAVGTRALDFLAGRRKLVLCLCIVIILLALFFPILYIAITASSVS